MLLNVCSLPNFFIIPLSFLVVSTIAMIYYAKILGNVIHIMFEISVYVKMLQDVI